MVKLKDAKILWTPASNAGEPTPGRVVVWDAARGRCPKEYSMSGGPGCWFAEQQFSKWKGIAKMMLDFHTMVVRDGVSPQDAHRAFLAIDEYRQRISRDIEGAEDLDE